MRQIRVQSMRRALRLHLLAWRGDTLILTLAALGHAGKVGPVSLSGDSRPTHLNYTR